MIVLKWEKFKVRADLYVAQTSIQRIRHRHLVVAIAGIERIFVDRVYGR
jgi:hypothetical protein